MDVAILGLGRFGTQLSQELVSIGVQVLAVDSDPARVNSIVEDVFLAAEGNVTNVEFLESLGLHSYDSVVVAIGSDVATSVLVTLTLKQRLRHRHVVSKARDSEHARALELAGADTVVTTCSNCRLQFKEGFAHYKLDTQVTGLAELMAQAIVE